MTTPARIPFEQWRAKYDKMMTIVNRIEAMRFARVQQECKLAGIGAWHGCIVHNALIALEEGKPWAGIDYSHLRRANYLYNHQFDAHRIVDAWSKLYWPN